MRLLNILSIISIIAFILISFLVVKSHDEHAAELLMAGIYIFCAFFCILRFIYTFKLWKENKSGWAKEMNLSYLFTFLLVLFISILWWLKQGNVGIAIFLEGMVFLSFPFLFPIGLALLVLGFMGLKYNTNNPSSYLRITFIAAFGFIIVGAPTLFIWLGLSLHFIRI
jgi:hypothetical protein